jgi:hypothetical protein
MFTLLATAKPFAARPKLYSIVFLLSAFFSLLGASAAQAASKVNALTAIVSDRSAPTLITDTQQSITEYLVGYYSQTRPHQHNRGLSPNAAEGAVLD